MSECIYQGLLKNGDSRPPHSNILRLYGMRFDPYSAGLRLIMRAKQLDLEVYTIKMNERPDFLKEMHPQAQVPVLEHGEVVVYESLIIYEYIEDAFPDRPLRSSDPATRATDRMFLHEFYAHLAPTIRGLMMNECDSNRLLDELLRVENQLSKRGRQYFGGDTANYVDYMIWSWMELIPAMKRARSLSLELPRANFSNLWAWIGRMDKNQVINADRRVSQVNVDVRSRFFKSVADGNPDYMIGMA